tara:strand:+ start:3920 stop:4231 length:312 start_codon:yes stop_codon:yes gene_type:complete
MTKFLNKVISICIFLALLFSLFYLVIEGPSEKAVSFQGLGVISSINGSKIIVLAEGKNINFSSPKVAKFFSVGDKVPVICQTSLHLLNDNKESCKLDQSKIVY